jgi:hypothetical protein
MVGTNILSVNTLTISLKSDVLKYARLNKCLKQLNIAFRTGQLLADPFESLTFPLLFLTESIGKILPVEDFASSILSH